MRILCSKNPSEAIDGDDGDDDDDDDDEDDWDGNLTEEDSDERVADSSDEEEKERATGMKAARRLQPGFT